MGKRAGGKEGREENTENIAGLEMRVLIFISFYFLRIALWLPRSTTGVVEMGGGAQWRPGWQLTPTFTTQRRTRLCTRDLGSKVCPEPAVTVPCISLSSNDLAPVVGMIQGIRAAGAQSSGL